MIQESAHSLPDYILGDMEGKESKERYGVAALTPIHEAGKKGEFVSKNFRYFSKQTFALRIGYDGNRYYGYQMQKYCPGITVESDLRLALGCNTIGAGRTDRGVSAVSQVICFANDKMDRTPEYYMEKFKSSKPFLEGRLAVYDCQRVPKKFHSRASATWRRYLYMFPLNRVDAGAVEKEDIRGVYDPVDATVAKYDVDVEFLNRMLSRLENLDLPYNAFAFKVDRVAGNGLLDKCILYKARAHVVNLAAAVPGTTWTPVPTQIMLDPSEVRVYVKKDNNAPSAELEGTKVESDPIVSDAIVLVATEEATTTTTNSSDSTIETTANDITKVATEHSTAMEIAPQLLEEVDHSATLPGLSPISLPLPLPKGPKPPKGGGDVDGFDDGDEDQEDTYATTTSASTNEAVRGTDPTVTVEVPEGAEIPALCIELVGSRFLRRMVRILSVS
jgi:tRNA U38,U39,U40 pseudouridine synthase TruA